ncbi:O-antigen ligase family protein [Marivirga arenosa]|uniref:O-antigen ligase family protein n=1 Tax=Marivirga arenosa TaxID=3059076 RepID=A0AA51ZVY3_9BACT|nr:O-antigen ligase family protein [Marivirga sp. BKB1-2]WNB17744.1 O-antigen ligase family protein [Marivirga sp. BKB1-2]
MGIILNSSRIGYVILFLILITYFIYILVYQKNKRLLIVVTVTFIILSTALSFHPRVQDSIKNPSGFFDGEKYKRIKIWETSMQLIGENPFWGVGVNNVQLRMREMYNIKNHEELYEKNYNAHNLYFDTYLAIGVFGFFVLLAIFYLSTYLAYKNKNYELLFFGIIFGIFGLVESNLSLYAGVSFFSFFLVMLSKKI